MKKQEVSLTLMNKVLVPIKGECRVPVTLREIMTFNCNLMSLGYTLSQQVITACTERFYTDEFKEWCNELQDILIDRNGSRQNMKPMYPGFPKQIIEMDEAELHMNALLHYITNGKWHPEYKEKLIKFNTPSLLKPKVINLATEEELQNYIQKIAESPISMSQQQKEMFVALINEYKEEIKLKCYDIPNKENMAFIIHETSKLVYEDEYNVLYRVLAAKNVKTITDILRLSMAYLGGDVSLCEKTRLRSIKRKDRKFLLSLINIVCKNQTEENVREDAARYQKEWIVVLEKLHPGDYSNISLAYKFATMVREEKIRTWYSKLEKAYDNKDIKLVVELLSKRPGEFARRLERTLRLANETNDLAVMNIILAFQDVAKDVDNTILLQLQAHFCNIIRNYNSEFRSFFPKGGMSRVYVKKETREPLPLYCLLSLKKVLRQTLILKYSDRDNIGNVYIDEKVSDFALPLKLRNASSQLHTVPRGSRIKLPQEANVIRLYTWWKNLDEADCNNDWESTVDIDLSATFYDNNFDTIVKEVSYYNMKIDGAVHSGDFVDAPNGAAEFIDIDIEKLLSQNVRYIAMNINSFSYNNFNTIPDCFAGVMLLNKLEEKEYEDDNVPVFDPAKSFVRSDISTEATACIPLVFDLKKKEFIWVDSIVPIHSNGPNNVAHCKDSITNLVRGIITAAYPRFGDLILMHVAARNGKIVDNIDDADVVFALDKGITPYDLEIINSELI